jgi:L-threonylcarbamoyladenylate synthase
MQTLLLDSASDGAIHRAAELLRGGGLVAFPTETVYGLGALGLEAEAVERIFAAKGRPHSDPLILHVADVQGARALVRVWTPTAEALAAAFWPGPLTLVLPKSERVPGQVTAGLDSVAVRVPRHPVALALLRAVGAPLAAPSANLFSHTSPTTARHVLDDLDGRIDAVLDGGPTEVGVESTVVDLRGDLPVILRPGGVTRAELERALGMVVRLGGEVAAGEGHRSPGLLEKHYSPRAEVRLYSGNDAAVLAALRRAIAEMPGSAVLAYAEDGSALDGLTAPVMMLGRRAHPEEVARALYTALRRLDELGVAVIHVRTAPDGGLGDAINDRLRRAASVRIDVPS